jgi:hypothetical protein
MLYIKDISRQRDAMRARCPESKQVWGEKYYPPIYNSSLILSHCIQNPQTLTENPRPNVMAISLAVVAGIRCAFVAAPRARSSLLLPSEGVGEEAGSSPPRLKICCKTKRNKSSSSNNSKRRKGQGE